MAIATKYPAVIVVLLILLAYILNHSWNDFPKLIVSGIASLSGAFAGSPFLFLDFRTVLSDIMIEARPRHLGATGEGFIHNIMWYVQGPLSDALSLIGLILIVPGIILCLASKEKEKWLLLMFPAFFLCFIAALNLRWARWIIPVIPFLCVLSALAFYWVLTWTGQNLNLRGKNLIGFILLLSLFVPLLKADILQGREMNGKDTRTLAREWVMEHIPQQSRILVEKYTPYLPIDRYAFLVVNNSGELTESDRKKIKYSVFSPPFTKVGKLNNIGAIHEKNVEYMILSDWYDRYLREREYYSDYAKIVVMYETLMKTGTKIYEVKRIPGKNRGPTIQVYRFDGKKQRL